MTTKTIEVSPEQDALLQILRVRTKGIAVGDLAEAMRVLGAPAFAGARGRTRTVSRMLHDMRESGLVCAVLTESPGRTPRLLWTVAKGLKRLRSGVYSLPNGASRD